MSVPVRADFSFIPDALVEEAGAPSPLRLSFIPDALVEEAAKRMAATDAPWEPPFYGMDVLARVALGVLFPGEEEE